MINTQYISKGTKEVSVDVFAESSFATVNINGLTRVGKVEDYKVQITDIVTKVPLLIESEDGNTKNEYEVWFI